MARSRKTTAPKNQATQTEQIEAQTETQTEAVQTAQVEPIEQTAATEAPKSKGLGIGALVKDLIGQGLNTDDILAQIKEQFPTASTNRACVAWYRSDLKRKASLALAQQ